MCSAVLGRGGEVGAKEEDGVDGEANEHAGLEER